MRLGALLTTVVGIAVAGGSAYVAMTYVDQQSRVEAATRADVVEVVVAQRDIALGQAIEPHLLTSIAWPADAVPQGVYTDYKDLLPATGMPARRARRAIAQGELLLVSKISDFGEKVTITQTLGPNLRAMAIKVDAETAVGGFVTPGDRVDVVLTQGREQDLRAVTILQNIRVIGVDQEADTQSDQVAIARTVTVEVSPTQGQTLALAQKAGTLSLSLRTLESTDEDKPLDSIRLSDVLRDKSPEPETAKAPTIIVRRGVEVTEEAR